MAKQTMTTITMRNKITKPDSFLITQRVPKSGEKTLEDIQKFVEKKQWKFCSEELRQEVLRFISIGTALNNWLETIEHLETKRKYKGAVQRLFLDKESLTRIEPNFSIECIDSSTCIGMYKHILEYSDVPASTKQLCTTVYARFCDFIRTETYGIIDPEVGLREQTSFRKAEEIYNDLNWDSFLVSIEMPYRLIARLIYLSGSLWKYRLRVCDHKNNMLSLRVDQLDFNKNTISFHGDQSYHVKGLVIPFPCHLMLELKSLVGDRKDLVFRSSTGKKLLPNQIERSFAKASKLLNLPYQITPVILSWIGVIAHENRVQDQIRIDNSLFKK